MCFIFQFHVTQIELIGNISANTCYCWSILLIRCILLIFCGKKIGGSCLQQLLKLILYAVYCSLCSHHFHCLKWKLLQKNTLPPPIIAR